MHETSWLFYAAIVLLSWGVVGIFQKLATNYISAESTLVWLMVGFLAFQVFLYPGRALFQYSTRSLMWGLLSGLLSNLGAWGLFAAMKHGGKASIVAPLTAMYPVIVVLLAPWVFGETITLLQGAGVACALIAAALLAA